MIPLIIEGKVAWMPESWPQDSGFKLSLTEDTQTYPRDRDDETQPFFIEVVIPKGELAESIRKNSKVGDRLLLAGRLIGGAGNVQLQFEANKAIRLTRL